LLSSPFCYRACKCSRLLTTIEKILMFKWIYDWLDKLDGNVDGAIFGLNKAVKKLEKAEAANERQASITARQAVLLHEKATAHGANALRAKRVKDKLEELLK